MEGEKHREIDRKKLICFGFAVDDEKFTLKNESGLHILSINVNGNKRYGPRGSLLVFTLKTISSGIIKRLSFHDCDINISAT